MTKTDAPYCTNFYYFRINSVEITPFFFIIDDDFIHSVSVEIDQNLFLIIYIRYIWIQFSKDVFNLLFSILNCHFSFLFSFLILPDIIMMMIDLFWFTISPAMNWTLPFNAIANEYNMESFFKFHSIGNV